MLVLSREKKNESIVINNDITVTVVEIRGDKGASRHRGAEGSAGPPPGGVLTPSTESPAPNPAPATIVAKPVDTSGRAV